MQVLFYSQTNYLVDRFVDLFIPRGITLIHCDQQADVVEKIANLRPEFFLLDMNRENFEEALKVIALTRHLEERLDFKPLILIYVQSLGREMIARALKEGVMGFIKNDSTDNDIIQYFLYKHEKVTGRKPVLKYERMILDPEIQSEYVAVKFHSERTGRSILGVIHDISAGGMVIRLKGNFDPDDIAVDMEIESLRFILLGQEIVLKAVVRAFKQDLCAIRFLKVSEQDMHQIAQFLFMKISQLI